MQQTKRVGIWIRVSTEDQVKGESPEHHEKRARLYAEVKEWQVVEVYRLDGLSGKSVKDYPETKRMIHDIQTKHIDGLIFSKLARLARNTKELLEFAELFREHGADLISLGESIDTSTPAGRLFYTMIAAMAQWEREEIAGRVAASVPIRAKMGKPLGGAAPFGYQWKDGSLVPHEDEAPIRKLVHELFREHRRKKTVARMLNDRGCRTRNGSKFSATTVGRLIEDPTAKGLRRANYTSSTDSTKAWTLKPEHEWIFHEVPAIITAELWDECNAIIHVRKGSRPITQRVRHLFAGRVYCECGTKMYVPSNSPKYTCADCRNKIPTEDLEVIFHEQLRSFFYSRDEIDKHLTAFTDRIAGKEEELAVIAKDRSKLITQMDKLYDLYQSGDIDKRGFGSRYQPLQERLDQLEVQIPELQAEIDYLKITSLSCDEVISHAQDLYAHWQNLTGDEKRQIVEVITERVTVGKEEVDIQLYDSPTFAPPPQLQGNVGSLSDDGNRVPQPHGFIAATN